MTSYSTDAAIAITITVERFGGYLLTKWFTFEGLIRDNRPAEYDNITEIL